MPRTDVLRIIKFVFYAEESPLRTRRRAGRSCSGAARAGLLAVGLALTIALAVTSFWIGSRPNPTEAEQPNMRDRTEKADTNSLRSVAAPPSVDATTVIPTPKSGEAKETRVEETPALPRKSPHVVPSLPVRPLPTQSRAEPRTITGREAVRIGRFPSEDDAEQARANLVRQLPGLRGLPMVAVPIVSLRDGKTYYRLQATTSSRAHSDGLCQQAHAVDQSCTAVSLEHS